MSTHTSAVMFQSVLKPLAVTKLGVIDTTPLLESSGNVPNWAAWSLTYWTTNCSGACLINIEFGCSVRGSYAHVALEKLQWAVSNAEARSDTKPRVKRAGNNSKMRPS